MIKDERDIYIELYKRKEFDKIPIGIYENNDYFFPTKPQIKALTLLNDPITTNVGYGGSARSGKSIIESAAIILECLGYDGIAWGLGRKELTTLKRTVLITFFKQLTFYGLQPDKDYNYNQQLNKISFENGSELFLIDTAFQPSDPLNTRFGGFELTKCAIDESNETELSVIIKLFERTGWRLNDKYNIKRKLFECFNPAKNHVYFRFWVPFRNKAETEDSKFIQALPSDNPHPAVKEWINDMMKTADPVTIQRQVHGNFDYDNDPSSLCGADAIMDLFTNDHVREGNKFLAADLAMQGRDRYIASMMNGGIITIESDKQKTTGKEIEDDLNHIRINRKIPNSRIVADSDGLGSYLSSYILNIIEFHGGSTKCDKEYENIKSQCGFKLAEMINNRELKIICSPDQKEKIISEISVCLKRENLDSDTQKKKLMPKKKMKENLGHSPDYLDTFIMLMIFKIKSLLPGIIWQ